MKIKKIKTILILLLLIFNFAILINPIIAATPAGKKILDGLINTGTEAGLGQDKPKNVVQILGFYINAILNLLGVLFLILVIYGGALWMTAAGNEEKITKAKKIIISAAIGISIILLSKAITFAILELSRPAVEQQT